MSDIILRGIQDDEDEAALFRLAVQHRREHAGRKPRDVVIWTTHPYSSWRSARTYTTHWTKAGNVVAERHP